MIKAAYGRSLSHLVTVSAAGPLQLCGLTRSSRDVAAAINPAAPHHLPAFFTAPGETDILFNVMGIFLVVMVLMVIVFYFKLHSLPESSHTRGRRCSLK